MAIESIKKGKAVEIPDPPEALLLYEQCSTMGIPLVSGGLYDQPYIWLLEYAICERMKKYGKYIVKDIPEPTIEDLPNLDIRFPQDYEQ